jgi:hypothetical protein
MRNETIERQHNNVVDKPQDSTHHVFALNPIAPTLNKMYYDIEAKDFRQLLPPFTVEK